MARGNGEEITWLDDLVELIRHLHESIISLSGGLQGEHVARLYAACARPFQTAFGDELYPSDVDKAAALFHAIVSDHPFADGNKRTATVSTIMLLVAMGVISDVPNSLQVRLLGEIAVETAQGKLGVDEVGTWLSRILDLD